MDVFPRADGTAVCVTRSNIILLDESGKALEKLRVSQEFSPEKLSEKLIAYLPSASTLAIFDTEKFETISKLNLSKLGIDQIWGNIQLSDKYIIVCGKHEIEWVPREDGNGNECIAENNLWLFRREDLSLLKKLNLDEIGMGFCPKATPGANKVTLKYENPYTFERKIYEFTVE